MAGGIDYFCEHPIGIVTINRPRQRNAMTAAMIDDFMKAVKRAGSEAHVLIITGAGGAFCAGVDLKEVASGAGGHSLPERAEDRGRWWPVVECPIPVIAAVDGPAVGMGAEITTQCDIRLASPEATFAWNFALRGLVPDSGAGTWLLPRIIGIQKALKLLYTGASLSAQDALANGYVDAVVERENLLPAAKQLASQICHASPFATRKIKTLVYDGLESNRDDHVRNSKIALERCFASNDHKEGVAAFLERREARFSGT